MVTLQSLITVLFQTGSRSSTLFWANDFQLGPGVDRGLIIFWA